MTNSFVLWEVNTKMITEHDRTCEGKDGAVGPAARQEVGHVAAASVNKDGARVQVVGHLCSARAQLLAHTSVQTICQLRQHYLPVLLLPAAHPCLLCSALQLYTPCSHEKVLDIFWKGLQSTFLFCPLTKQEAFHAFWKGMNSTSVLCQFVSKRGVMHTPAPFLDPCCNGAQNPDGFLGVGARSRLA
jgi:hypothetical protein